MNKSGEKSFNFTHPPDSSSVYRVSLQLPQDSLLWRNCSENCFVFYDYDIFFFFHFWEFLNNYTGGYHGNISIAPPFQLPGWWVMGCQYDSAIVLNSITIATGSSVIFQMIRVFYIFVLISDRSLFFPSSNACPRKKPDPQAPC